MPKKDRLYIKDDLYLKISHPVQAEEIFGLIDRHRLDLERWLVWVHKIDELSKCRRMLSDAAKMTQGGQIFNTTIYYQEKIIGQIGFVRIDKSNDSGEMGYWLAPPFRGKGIMKKVFPRIVDFGIDRLGLNRIELKIAAANKASLSLPEKNGFVLEGKLQEAIRWGETYQDMMVYGVTKKQWKKRLSQFFRPST